MASSGILTMRKDGSMLGAALDLVMHRIPCFPCASNKRPTCPGGYKSATNNPDDLKLLWTQYPGTLIGVPTGAVSGFDVLDIDPRHDGDQWLGANYWKMPITRTHETRSGGKHLLFRHHDGLRNSAGKIASGVDVRADGGYIIWWPALGLPVLHYQTGATWPDWLLAVTKPVTRTDFVPQKSMISDNGAYASAALRNAAEKVAAASEGNRNHTLNRELWSLLRFTATGELHVQHIASTLAAAALAAGLKRSEIRATLISALRSRG